MNFPRLEAYLKQLPEGLASQPDMQGKGALVRQALEDGAFTADLGGLPPQMAALIRTPPSTSSTLVS